MCSCVWQSQEIDALVYGELPDSDDESAASASEGDGPDSDAAWSELDDGALAHCWRRAS